MSDDRDDPHRQSLKVRFENTVTFGSLVTLFSLGVAIVGGGWAVSTQIATTAAKTDALARQLDTLSENIQRMHADRDNDLALLKSRVDTEISERTRLDTQLRDEVARLTSQFDEWLRQRHGEVARKLEPG